MSKNISRHVTHLKSKLVENGSPKLPTANDLYDGEIAVNYAKGYETLSIKNDSGDVVTFKASNQYSSATEVNTALANKSKVSFTRILTGDTKIGTITIDNVSTDIYCSGGTSIDDTKIAFVGETMGSGDSVTHSIYYVWADSAQNIEAANQAIIRNNIGAAAVSDIPDVSTINSNISTISGDVSTLSGTVTTINSKYESKLILSAITDGSFTATVGYYYHLPNLTSSDTITLPTPTQTVSPSSIMFYATLNSVPTFSHSTTVLKQDGWSEYVVAGGTYEINAVYNGDNWLLTAVKFS